MENDTIYKVDITGHSDSSATLLVEPSTKQEKEINQNNNIKFFEDELEAYKFSVNVLNNIVSDLVDPQVSEDNILKQLNLLKMMIVSSTISLAELKGNSRLALNYDVWDSFYDKAISLAIGNIITKDISGEFKDFYQINDVKDYIVQWFLAYISTTIKHPLTDEKAVEIKNLVSETVNKTVNLILENNIEKEINNE